MFRQQKTFNQKKCKNMYEHCANSTLLLCDKYFAEFESDCWEGVAGVEEVKVDIEEFSLNQIFRCAKSSIPNMEIIYKKYLIKTKNSKWLFSCAEAF